MTSHLRSFLSLLSLRFCLLAGEVVTALTPDFALWGHSLRVAFGVVAIASCLFCFVFAVVRLRWFWSRFDTAGATPWTCSLLLPVAFWALPRLLSACLSPHSSTTALLWKSPLPWLWAWIPYLDAKSTGICLVTLWIRVTYVCECVWEYLHFWSSRMWELIWCKVDWVWPRGRNRHEVALFWSK